MLDQSILTGRITNDMTFSEKVWAITARIPKGKVTTYKHIAQCLGSTGYRAVGMAMNRNPYAPAVPCHRVVGSDGSLVGFAQGTDKKRRMLADEGVPMRKGRVVLGEALFEP
jgi:methylated-DNA-[protein]-cysteine S-methyltransferase